MAAVDLPVPVSPVQSTFLNGRGLPAEPQMSAAFVSTSASEDDVYNITKAIFDNIETITANHAKGSELSLENATSGMTAPFHKGAAKYFAEKGITVESK